MVNNPQGFDDIVDRYDVFLFDAFGVLRNERGPIPHARDRVRALQAAGKTCVVLTNDASRSPRAIRQALADMEFDFLEAHVVSSGGQLQDWVNETANLEAHVRVLGPESAAELAAEAGLVVVEPGAPFDVAVILDERGFPFVDVINEIFNAAASGSISLVVGNPDVIYPRRAKEYALAAGGVASLLFSMALARGVDLRPMTTTLGKPGRKIYEKALALTGNRATLMVGDQNATDIRGAHALGLDSVLVRTGIDVHSELATYCFDDLR